MSHPSSEPLRSTFSDDPEMRDLLELFVQELPQRVDALCEALNNKATDDLQYIAHQLKGAGAGYGFGPISDAAAELEEAMDAAASDAETIRAAFDRLVQTCSRAIT